MSAIDTRMGKEQLELLRAYRKFLAGQVKFVDSKLRSLEARAASKRQ